MIDFVVTEEARELTLEEYRAWVRADERLLESYSRLLNVLPPCPIHGQGCVPHAIEWVKQMKARGGHQ